MAHIAGAGLHILGIGAVDRVAGPLLATTQRLPARRAALTGSTGPAQPGDGHPVALGDLGDPGPKGGDDADPLMAGDQRQLWLDRPVAMGGVDVGVAQPGRLHPHQDLPESRLRHRHLLQLQGRLELMDHGCQHGGLLVVARSAVLDGKSHPAEQRTPIDPDRPAGPGKADAGVEPNSRLRCRLIVDPGRREETPCWSR
jgi:hypothetical protein